MVENDLSQLKALNIVIVVEVELHFLCVSVDLWELNCVPVSQSKVKLPFRNFLPATLKKVPYKDLYVSRSLSRVVTCTLEADAVED